MYKNEYDYDPNILNDLGNLNSDEEIKARISKYISILEQNGFRFPDNSYEMNLYATLIDAGDYTSKLNLVYKGIKGFEKLIKNVESKKIRVDILFNLTRGYDIILDKQMFLKQDLKDLPQPRNSRMWNKTKRGYQKIWLTAESGDSHKKAMSSLASLIGNKTGRVFEAIDLLDNVILLDKDFGLAHLKRIDLLVTYAEQLGKIYNKYKNKKHHLSSAWSIIHYCRDRLIQLQNSEKVVKSIKKHGTLNSDKIFGNKIAWCESYLPKNLINSQFVAQKYKFTNQQIDKFVHFVSEKNLFISYCFFDANDAFGYTFNVPLSMCTDLKFDDRNLNSIIKEILESYVYLTLELFESTKEQQNLENEIDLMADYFSHPFEAGLYNGVNVRRLKSVIEESYNIFDKIMVALNIYHNSNENLQNITWSKDKKFFIEEIEINSQNKKFLNDRINSNENKYLLALYDLRCDMNDEDGIYKDLKMIRNSIAHRHLKVFKDGSLITKTPNHESVHFSELNFLANKSLKLARAGIMYMLMHFNLSSLENDEPVIDLEFVSQSSKLN